MTNILILNTDHSVHAAGKDDCKPCLDSYPQPHACGGRVHAEYRFDMEAGFEWKYLVRRCDNCDFQSTEEVKPQAATASATATDATDETTTTDTPERRYLLSGDVTHAARVSAAATSEDEAIRKAEAGDFIIEERVEKGATFRFDGGDDHIEIIEN